MIELIVVSILDILALIALINYGGAIKSSKEKVYDNKKEGELLGKS